MRRAISRTLHSVRTWGLRLVDKDRELHGPSANGKLFVMLSDGEHTSRVNPLLVAEVATGAGVRVFPIGLGLILPPVFCPLRRSL